MALNHRGGAFVVIAASGMCENGRVLHHLRHSVEDPNNTVVIIGFQAEAHAGAADRRKAALPAESTTAITSCRPTSKS